MRNCVPKLLRKQPSSSVIARLTAISQNLYKYYKYYKYFIGRVPYPLQGSPRLLFFSLKDHHDAEERKVSMISIENEIILLSQWLKGMHREDIDIFDSQIFQHRKLFEDIKEGATITQIGAKTKEYGITLAELLGADGYGAWYYGARGEAAKEQQAYYTRCLNDADFEDQQKWIDRLTEITNFINAKESTPRSANFSDLFMRELTERQNEKNPHYGLRPIDRDTEGLHRGQLIVLSARPGSGKSALALQITNNVIREGYKVMYLPLEMTEYETFQRMIIQEQVVFNAQEAKRPTTEQIEDIRSFLDSREKSGLFAMYYGMNQLQDIEKRTKEEQPFLVVIDQLTQVEPGVKVKDIREKYLRITNALKRLALQENVCILALHQLNRASTERKKPGIENLAESDSVGRDADVVLILNSDDEEEAMFNELRQTELLIAKNRQGAIGGKITLQFSGNRYTFYETEYRQQPTANRTRH